MNTHERIAALLAQFDARPWASMPQRDKDRYLSRAAAIVAVVWMAENGDAS